MNRLFPPVLLVVAAALLSPSWASTFYVDRSVEQSGDGRSWSTAFMTIQEGIDALSHGDTLIVAPGTYFENLRIGGKNVTLRSINPLDPELVADTIIDGSRLAPVVAFDGPEDETCLLSGFTIRNGEAQLGGGIMGGALHDHSLAAIENNIICGNFARSGAGLFACDGIIRNNTIVENTAEDYGGGLVFCNGLIEGNTIARNLAEGGAGLFRCDGTIRDNLIAENQAALDGGGLRECDGSIERNTIAGNHSGWQGGGLMQCNAVVVNNIIAGNAAARLGGGLALCSKIGNCTIVHNSADLGGGFADCAAPIRNCIVWENTDTYGYQIAWSDEPEYSCIQNWKGGGIGNIALQPRFIDLDGPDNDPATYQDNDCHLSSASPCIDAGICDEAPTGDMDHENRPQGAGVDIGADEYADTDTDTLPDYWERRYFGGLPFDGIADPDLDGVTNLEELVFNTDPTDGDTDEDGFGDGDEIVTGNDPNDPLSSPPAADFYVDAALGSDAYHGRRPLRAKRTIQAAVNASSDADTIVVMPGIYPENVQYLGKNLVLRSMDPCDPAVVENTIIDGGGAGPVVSFEGTEDQSSLLAGFTIQNGYFHYGGGVYGGADDQRTLATIRNNVIAQNSADFGGGVSGCNGTILENVFSGNAAVIAGGGLYGCDGNIDGNAVLANSAGLGGGLSNCHGVVRENRIAGNWAQWGGGLSWCNTLIERNTIEGNSSSGVGGGLSDCSGVIRSNLIRGNSARIGGGGLYSCGDVISGNAILDNHAETAAGGGLANCSGTIQNNLVAGNSASYGGGLFSCLATVLNNTIVANRAHSGPGGGIFNYQPAGSICNCILWANTAAEGDHQLHEAAIPVSSCIQDWPGTGGGNISLDPRFLDPDGLDDDPNTFHDNDYHLAGDSPCIDAGCDYRWYTWPQQDADGNCRLAGSHVDIGCYEHGALPDFDGDLISDFDESGLATDPSNEDTDADGLRDGLERLRGSNPLSPTSPSLLRVPSAFPTIQAALCLSMNADEIVLAPGTYYENLRLFGHNVVLRSDDPENPDTVATTIIDGRMRGPVVSFVGNETEQCVLEGVTIQNGAGGILGQGTHATIQNNTIIGNRADDVGGVKNCAGLIRENLISGNAAFCGAGLTGCDGRIEENIIVGNKARRGGGVYQCDGTILSNTISYNDAEERGGGLAHCDGTIQNNTIVSNSAGDQGGGLFGCRGSVITVPPDPSTPYRQAIIRGNLIAGNLAGCGGGLYDCNAVIESNTIVENSATQSAGGLGFLRGFIVNCIIWGNVAPESPQLPSVPGLLYCCIQDWTEGGEGNTAEPPMFVDPDGPDNDPLTFHDNDYRLSMDSSCIDRGRNEAWMHQAVDLDGNPRVFYGGFSRTVDLGAYEHGSWAFKVVGLSTESSGQAALLWTSRPGDSYVVWSCSDLLAGEWKKEAAVVSQGNSTSWLDTATIALPKFYCIEIGQ